jgi:hypothetical protein
MRSCDMSDAEGIRAATAYAAELAREEVTPIPVE